MTIHVLILCTHNSARSVLGEVRAVNSSKNWYERGVWIRIRQTDDAD